MLDRTRAFNYFLRKAGMKPAQVGQRPGMDAGKAALMRTAKLVRVMEKRGLGVVPKRKDGFGNEAFSTKTPEFTAMGVPVVIPNTGIDSYYFKDSWPRFLRRTRTRAWPKQCCG